VWIFLYRALSTTLKLTKEWTTSEIDSKNFEIIFDIRFSNVFAYCCAGDTS
jgi:hypothetical protein